MAKTDTIVAHCVARAVTADAGGEEAAKAKFGPNAERLRASKWAALKVSAKATPRAARVASFIALWGAALDDLDRDEITVDEYAEWANESRATAFRRASEYRELWPDVEINVLAGRVRDHIRSHRALRRNPSSLMSIPITA